jgi:hypothetical protein
MHTPWGSVVVADAHVHFFSHRFFGLLGQQMSAPHTAEAACAKAGWVCPPADPVMLAKQWAGELERHGVDHAVLIASLPDDADSVQRAVAAVPGRFSGYFLANPVGPGASESVRAAFEHGMRGLVLFPAMHRYSVMDDRAVALIEEAAAHPNPVVVVHCGVLSVGVRKRLGLPSRFDMRFSNPIDLHPLASQFPTVNFVVPHFGAGYFREALMLADLCENVFFDTSSSNRWTSFQVENPDLTTVFRRALEVVGARRLLFGTDSSYFPRGWQKAVFDEQVQALWQAGVQKQEAEAILGGNLRRLLGR